MLLCFQVVLSIILSFGFLNMIHNFYTHINQTHFIFTFSQIIVVLCHVFVWLPCILILDLIILGFNLWTCLLDGIFQFLLVCFSVVIYHNHIFRFDDTILVHKFPNRLIRYEISDLFHQIAYLFPLSLLWLHGFLLCFCFLLLRLLKKSLSIIWEG